VLHFFILASFLLQVLVRHTLSRRVGTQGSLLIVQDGRKLKLLASVYGTKFDMNSVLCPLVNVLGVECKMRENFV
jgi:hypothetical protein